MWNLPCWISPTRISTPFEPRSRQDAAADRVTTFSPADDNDPTGLSVSQWSPPRLFRSPAAHSGEIRLFYAIRTPLSPARPFYPWEWCSSQGPTAGNGGIILYSTVFRFIRLVRFREAGSWERRPCHQTFSMDRSIEAMGCTMYYICM